MLILTSHSYKGGTGKTVVAVNLANVLHKVFGKKVLLLELDTVAPSFVDIFVNVNPSKFWDDFFGGLSLEDI
ncbi:MAG: AAA family ATPase, partial [Candidatus Odinarchaeota archaeon]